MRHYLIKYALICIFTKQKSEYWIKPDSKFVFDFVDKVFGFILPDKKNIFLGKKIK